MPIKFEIVEGETEHVSFGGKRARRSTVLLRVHTPYKSVSLSKKAALLGLGLVVCQICDGLLTYVGLRLFGVHMEANGILRGLMHYYGLVPALLGVKIAAIVVTAILMVNAHRRRWIRPIILLLIVIYLSLALVPWAIIISKG